jgi:hypothetical protein
VLTGYAATKEMRSPNGVIAETIQENCKSLVAIFVDESSLIGCATLGWLDLCVALE